MAKLICLFMIISVGSIVKGLHPCNDDNSAKQRLDEMIGQRSNDNLYDMIIISNVPYTIINPVNTTIFVQSDASKMSIGYTVYRILKHPISDSSEYFPCNCSYAYLAQMGSSYDLRTFTYNTRYESTIRSDIQITLTKNNTNDSIYCYDGTDQGCRVYLYCGQISQPTETLSEGALVIENPVSYEDEGKNVIKHPVYSNSNAFVCNNLMFLTTMWFSLYSLS